MNASRERETLVRGLVTRASVKKALAVCLSELEQQNLFITNGLFLRTGHKNVSRPPIDQSMERERERKSVCMRVCVCAATEYRAEQLESIDRSLSVVQWLLS